MNVCITRFDPFRDITALQDRVQRLFEGRLFRFDADLGSEAFQAPGWSPAVDIVETDNEIVLKADLPGVNPDDVDISVEDGTLTVKGERRFESDVKEDDYRRLERVYGSFVRRFALPSTVDTDKVQAAYRNGVLELTLPKRAEAKPKPIKVAVKN
jgi:HSP20 family protein